MIGNKLNAIISFQLSEEIFGRFFSYLVYSHFRKWWITLWDIRF